MMSEILGYTIIGQPKIKSVIDEEGKIIIEWVHPSRIAFLINPDQHTSDHETIKIIASGVDVCFDCRPNHLAVIKI